MAKDVYLASTGQGAGSGTGVVTVASGKVPKIINGRKVVRAAMIGTTDTAPDQLERNWRAVDAAIDPRLLGANIGDVLARAVGPRAQDIAGWPDWAKQSIADKGYGTGSAWFAGRMAEPGVTWDLAPTKILVGTVAGVGAGAVLGRVIGGGEAAAGEEAAAGAEAGAATTATAGGVAGGAAAKVADAAKKAAGAAAKNPKGVLGALTIASLFTNIGLWKGLGLTVAGAVLILIGILQLSGMSAGVAARKVIP